MSRVINMSIPKLKHAALPKTAALTKAQTEHKAIHFALGARLTLRVTAFSHPVHAAVSA